MKVETYVVKLLEKLSSAIGKHSRRLPVFIEKDNSQPTNQPLVYPATHILYLYIYLSQKFMFAHIKIYVSFVVLRQFFSFFFFFFSIFSFVLCFNFAVLCDRSCVEFYKLVVVFNVDRHISNSELQLKCFRIENFDLFIDKLTVHWA